MSLLRLPNEVVLEMVGSLDVCDIKNLVQSCRRLAHCLSAHLYMRDVRDNNSYSLFWACENSRPNGGDWYYRTASHAIAAGANVKIAWTQQGKFFSRAFYLEPDSRHVSVSPIELAVLRDNTRMAQLLVKSGADINLQPGRARSPITLAAKLGKKAVIAYLLEQKVNICAKPVFGKDALCSAVESGDLDILASLLAAVGDEDNTKQARMGATLAAVRGGKEQALQMLLRSDNLNLNHIGAGNQTVLAAACEGSSLKCVQLLYKDKRANINMFSRHYYSPIENAINYRRWDIALYLVRSGRLHQRRWEQYFKSLCRDGSVKALEVAKEMIWRANLTISLATRFKKATLQHGCAQQLDGIIDAKLEEWSWRE